MHFKVLKTLGKGLGQLMLRERQEQTSRNLERTIKYNSVLCTLESIGESAVRAGVIEILLDICKHALRRQMPDLPFLT